MVRAWDHRAQFISAGYGPGEKLPQRHHLLCGPVQGAVSKALPVGSSDAAHYIPGGDLCLIGKRPVGLWLPVVPAAVQALAGTHIRVVFGKTIHTESLGHFLTPLLIFRAETAHSAQNIIFPCYFNIFRHKIQGPFLSTFETGFIRISGGPPLSGRPSKRISLFLICTLSMAQGAVGTPRAAAATAALSPLSPAYATDYDHDEHSRDYGPDDNSGQVYRCG